MFLVDALQSEDEGETAGKDGANEGSGSALIVATVGGLGGGSAAGGLGRVVLSVGLGGGGTRLGGLLGVVGAGGLGASLLRLRGSVGSGGGGVAAAAATVVGGALTVLVEEVSDALLGAAAVGLGVGLRAVTLVALSNTLNGVDGLGLVGAGDLSSMLAVDSCDHGAGHPSGHDGEQVTYGVAVSQAVHVRGVALINAGNDGGLDGVELEGGGAGLLGGGGLGTSSDGESASNEDGGETHGD